MIDLVCFFVFLNGLKKTLQHLVGWFAKTDEFLHKIESLKTFLNISQLTLSVLQNEISKVLTMPCDDLCIFFTTIWTASDLKPLIFVK